MQVPYNAIWSRRGGSGSSLTFGCARDDLDRTAVGLENDFDGLAARPANMKTVGEDVVIAPADGADIEIVGRAGAA